MKAVCWTGVNDVRVEQVPEPSLLNPRDAIIKVRATTICGSDLHLYDGYIPSVLKGDILGHEFMGEVVEVGSGNKKLKVGDRVVVPFTICCGDCDQCRRGNFSVCERSNRNKEVAEKMFGHTTA
ncbi:alcohol dehydrogenase catalytic domain-containing protein, partial [Archangium sp.]|uniref:alcohol dehydrogenase catalytic domain-containing protein n=1 Tax=Archangium sp. TaxID=1872627 RepID=UPI002ED993DC